VFDSSNSDHYSVHLGLYARPVRLTSPSSPERISSELALIGGCVRGFGCKRCIQKRIQKSSSDAKYLIRCEIVSDLADFLFASKLLILKRKWWNWQTHHLEGVAPKGVGVQIPPSAP
jgi:hypothetical protein